MRVLHLSTYDRWGGAAIAAARLHDALRGHGVESLRLVQRKDGDDPATLGPTGRLGKVVAAVRPALASIPVRYYRRPGKELFSTAALPERMARRVDALAPDLVHLHWVGHGFLRLETIPRLKRPVVWTLHDSWTFTGGCHVPFQCVRYRDRCGACPALGSKRERDLSRRVWDRKRRTYGRSEPLIVAPSRWIAAAARSSSLLRGARVEIIANGVDLTRFRPVDRNQARSWLGLPGDRKIVLFGGHDFPNDPNKGGEFLVAVAKRLAALGWRERILFVIFGASRPESGPTLDVETRYLGRLGDEISLALVYASADVFVAPSIQENQPNTILEAMACGTPCVGFDTSGISELIEHGRDGRLAAPYSADSLAEAVAWTLEDEHRRVCLGAVARARAERDHDVVKAARRYADLYRSILDARGASATSRDSGK